MSNNNKENNSLKTKRIIWLIWLAILVISAYVIPYVFLDGVQRVTGAFLFWSIFALVAIGSTIRIISYWRD
jgi:positive regulator of sigma E activity